MARAFPAIERLIIPQLNDNKASWIEIKDLHNKQTLKSS